MRIDSRAWVPSGGQRVLLTQRTALHARIPQEANLTEDGSSHTVRGTLGTNLEVVILPS